MHHSAVQSGPTHGHAVLPATLDIDAQPDLHPPPYDVQSLSYANTGFWLNGSYFTSYEHLVSYRRCAISYYFHFFGVRTPFTPPSDLPRPPNARARAARLNEPLLRSKLAGVAGIQIGPPAHLAPSSSLGGYHAYMASGAHAPAAADVYGASAAVSGNAVHEARHDAWGLRRRLREDELAQHGVEAAAGARGDGSDGRGSGDCGDCEDSGPLCYSPDGSSGTCSSGESDEGESFCEVSRTDSEVEGVALYNETVDALAALVTSVASASDGSSGSPVRISELLARRDAAEACLLAAQRQCAALGWLIPAAITAASDAGPLPAALLAPSLISADAGCNGAWPGMDPVLGSQSVASAAVPPAPISACPLLPPLRCPGSCSGAPGSGSEGPQEDAASPAAVRFDDSCPAWLAGQLEDMLGLVVGEALWDA